jgi:predicted nicotinamide N-methyase
VLELGAGTALPGLLLAKLGACVTLTDAVHQPEVLANLEAACRVNGLEISGPASPPLSGGGAPANLVNPKP